MAPIAPACGSSKFPRLNWMAPNGIAPPADGEAGTPDGSDGPVAAVPGPLAGVPGIGRRCVKPGPAPNNPIIAATTHIRPVDPIEGVHARMRSASGATVMWKFVIDRSNQGD